MSDNETRAAILNAIRKHHYITLDDYDVEICAECAVEWPCTTTDLLNGKGIDA